MGWNETEFSLSFKFDTYKMVFTVPVAISELWSAHLKALATFEFKNEKLRPSLPFDLENRVTNGALVLKPLSRRTVVG